MEAFLKIHGLNFLRISVFLFLFCFVLPSSAVEKRWIVEDRLFEGLRDFRNVKPEDKFRFILDTEKSEIDISGFMEVLSRAKESKYNNSPLIDMRVKPRVFSAILSICENVDDSLHCEEDTQTKIKQAMSSLSDELLEKTRYPHYYQPMDTPEGQKALSEVRDALTSECPADCGEIRLDKGSQSEFDKLFPLIEKQKRSCLKKIVKNMAKQLKYHRLPNSCEKNKTHQVCENMSNNYNHFRDRLLRLTELIYGKSARSQTEMKLCSDCDRFSEKEKAKALDPKTLEDVWQQSQNCKELQKGEQKRVSAGTGLDREYPIRREMDDSYSGVLNLKFVAGDDYMPTSFRDVSRDEVPSYYRNLVKECLEKEANPKLLGPNGEKLQIVLEDESSGSSPCPEPATIIKIDKSKIRSSSTNYASDIVCPDIAHEVLHRFGLCDDYANEKRGYVIDSKTGKPIEMTDPITGKSATELVNVHAIKPAPGQKIVLKYDCRVTRTNSVMAHHLERWNNIFLRETETKTLVTPEQWNAILYGDCKEKNQLFNECSQLAYKTSFEDPTCLKKKQECEAQNALGTP